MHPLEEAGKLTLVEEASARTIFPALKIGGRFRAALPFWRRFVDNKTVLCWLEYGLDYEFFAGPPPPNSGTEYPLSDFFRSIRDQEIARYENMGVVVPLPQEDLDSAVFNGVFVVEQKNKLRPIIDQRFPNSFTRKIHFKMDSIRDVRDLIRPMDLMFTIDFKDAYLHLFYKRPYWKYGAFWHHGQAKCFTGMMFGQTHAPRWWTKVMRTVMKIFRSLGIRCVIYIDDLLVFCGPVMDTAIRIRNWVFSFLLNLGITINLKKSMLQPSRRLLYLGHVINSKTMVFSLAKEKLTALRKDVRKLLKAGRASARALARVLGKITSMSNAILPWRLRTRAMLLSKNQILKSTGNWDLLFPLSPRVCSELEFWLTSIQDWNGKNILEEEPLWTTTSDSSGLGYGGLSSHSKIARSWEEELRGKHSTQLETIAAARVISEVILSEDLREGDLLHQSDNTTAVSYLNKQGGRIQSLSLEVEELWDLCLERGITLRAKYVPGVNLSEADFYSRVKSRDSELKLPPSEFEKLLSMWNLKVDLFSTRFNRQTKDFVTLFPDPLALRTDAFSFTWMGIEGLYAFPPFNQIGRILSKARRENAELLLVTPFWSGATWWPDIQEMTKSQPLLIPGILLDLDNKPTNLKWDLLAWKL